MSNTGTPFENKVKRELQSHGWHVTRAAGSRGEADLVAIKAIRLSVPRQHGGPSRTTRHRILLVQCKTDGRLDPGEWNALYRATAEIHGIAILADRPKRGMIRYRELTGTKHRRAREGNQAWRPWSP